MKPEFRYFKCALNVEPVKSLYQQWHIDHEQRNKELDVIFDTIPFYEFWRGSENSIFGIVCHANNPEFEKIKEDKTYKFEMLGCLQAQWHISQCVVWQAITLSRRYQLNQKALVGMTSRQSRSV